MDPDERPSKTRKLDQADVAEPSASRLDDVLPLPDRKPLDGQANGADSETNKDSEYGAVEVEVDHEEDSSHAAVANDTTQPLSKNQLKKLRKKQEWEAGRGYRKAKRKQKIVEKKARKRAAREEAGATQQEQEQQKVARPRRPIRLPITFLIDCGFDHLMSEKERISLGSQLTRAYSDNSRAPYQAHLIISSWDGALKERFDTVLNRHYENWKGVRFEQGDFTAAAEVAREAMRGTRGGKFAGEFEKYSNKDGATSGEAAVHIRGEEPAATDLANGQLPTQPRDDGLQSDSSKQPNETADHPSPAQHLPEAEVIYLTSDSPYTLDELKPYSTYIIGGLVDKNRHKGICYKTACDMGIKTAKLPIGEYMEMQSRFVLATNHVVEIMLRWLECGNWGEAFVRVIPKRKGGKLKAEGDTQHARTPGDEDIDTGDEAEDA